MDLLCCLNIPGKWIHHQRWNYLTVHQLFCVLIAFYLRGVSQLDQVEDWGTMSTDGPSVAVAARRVPRLGRADQTVTDELQ